ncbi:hypothetical protein PsYK624_130690 [Phanerochaete sordida]|uniref:Uncharacterized protein n=1 Tax=Phanerochaete sordida TaxID=48140 RepID=A0A9P3GJW2_9APHY|nr:hypothetical protein PsYK624_130690 [Phanerochaete sordida]
MAADRPHSALKRPPVLVDVSATIPSDNIILWNPVFRGHAQGFAVPTAPRGAGRAQLVGGPVSSMALASWFADSYEVIWSTAQPICVYMRVLRTYPREIYIKWLVALKSQDASDDRRISSLAPSLCVRSYQVNHIHGLELSI